MTPELNSSQLQILQHALGLDQYGQGEMYRNHFCAGESDEDICRQLVAMGYMRLWPHADPNTGETPGYPYYNCSVTEAGKTVVLAQSPKPPKLTRGQQRYRRFLRAGLGISFGEFIKMESERLSDDFAAHSPRTGALAESKLDAARSGVCPNPVRWCA